MPRPTASTGPASVAGSNGRSWSFHEIHEAVQASIPTSKVADSLQLDAVCESLQVRTFQ